MERKYTENIEIEFNGINVKNEKSLHNSIKNWYYKPGDRMESKVEGFIIDIVRGFQLIEIQTKNIGGMKRKLNKLLKNHKIRIVYPIAVDSWIVLMDENKEIISRRKSPKRGRVENIFDEIVNIPDIINNENLELSVLLIGEESIRCRDGRGSWRRKGVSLVDRRLVDVYKEVIFNKSEDYLKLIPDEISKEFTNKILAKALGININLARKMTYSLKKLDLIEVIGKKGNELIYGILA